LIRPNFLEPMNKQFALIIVQVLVSFEGAVLWWRYGDLRSRPSSKRYLGLTQISQK